jgi:hypothetical protein
MNKGMIYCATCGLPKDLCVCDLTKKVIQSTSMETLIRDLWANKGLEVIEERVRALKGGKWRWIIIAKVKKESK